MKKDAGALEMVGAATASALWRGAEKARQREAEAQAALTEEEHAAIEAGRRAEDKLREARARGEQMTVGALVKKLKRLSPDLPLVARVPHCCGESGAHERACYPLQLTTVLSEHGFEYLLLEGAYEDEPVCVEPRG